MNAVVIVFLACALGQPNHCEDKRLQFAWEGSLKRCAMAAQPYIAQWIGDHPQWMVKEFHCEYPHTRNKADASGSVRGGMPVVIGCHAEPQATTEGRV